jgi:hypothetical protein
LLLNLMIIAFGFYNPNSKQLSYNLLLIYPSGNMC